ncbi:MAG TPA: hypothetical protein EYM49_02650 [Campylobacterales bacterium]|nr:hypothetical protein [Campylobacterales bacterium]
MRTIKETKLHYQKGTSNKVYNVYLVEVSTDSYLVNFEYGRAGGNLKEGSKTTSPVDLVKAQKVFDNLVNSKIKKEYKVEAGFNSSTGKEIKKRDTLSSDEYKTLLLERLSRAGELDTTKNTTTRPSNGATGFKALHSSKETITITSHRIAKVDNYEVSRLIYRAGELKIIEAKELIVKLYKMDTNEENAFYYAVAWALGRYRDPNLRATIESLRDKLDQASRYIVEEALFALHEKSETLHIEALVLPMPFRDSLKDEHHESFITQVKLLEDGINSTYQRYKDADDYWDDELRTNAKKELMPLLAQADELYLKLYMLAIVDKNRHEAIIKIIHFLPLNEFNFSLFRRLYKMAEFREDQAVLAELITKIESKRLACYKAYDYSSRKYKSTIGCSRIYFKKRSLRYIKNIATHDEASYLEFAKNILLSINGYEKEFESFTTEWYDDNWNIKTKKYDAYSTHLTFMSILYGAGKRYMLTPNRKRWETVNSSIKDEHRPEMYKELWDKHPHIALEILSKSRVKEVQHFAFSIIEEHPDVITNASLSELIPMLNSHYDKAREFFFELLKKRYEQTKEEEIVKIALFSLYPLIIDFALEMIAKDNTILNDTSFVADAIWKIKEESRFNSFVNSIPDNKNSNDIITKVLEYIENGGFSPEKNRTITMIKKLISGLTIEQIEYLLSENQINTKHYIALELIRYEKFKLELPLELKEKIAMQDDDPEMLATTIYLLGKLSNEELIEAHEMLISFLYHKEVVVHDEARKIISTLGKEQKNAEILLQAIVEKSFASASDKVADNVAKTVESLSVAYDSVNTDQLYRMLIAKSKLALRLGTLILSNYKATDFSVIQWARLAKNPNKAIRVWAYDAYINNVEMVQKAMPKSLMIFDTHWEDTRQFASGYFESFEPLTADDIVVITDSNYHDVQLFAKKIILERDFDNETIMLKLSQHPALTIQKFVTDLMLSEMSNAQLLKMERFFNTLLHSVNSNRVAKTRVMQILNRRLDEIEIAQMYGRLASHHYTTMVWADKEVFVEAMSYIKEKYIDIELPLIIEESKEREVI